MTAGGRQYNAQAEAGRWMEVCVWGRVCGQLRAIFLPSDMAARHALITFAST